MSASRPLLAGSLCLALAGALLLSACGGQSDSPAADTGRTTLPPEAQEAVGAYATQAGELVARVDAGAPVEELRERTQALLDAGVALLPAYIAVRPECEAYLTAAARITELWPTLDLDTIESDYHDDGALPTNAQTPACYNMKDLVVHPATGLALLAQDEPDLEGLRKEVAEIVAHAIAVQHRP